MQALNIYRSLIILTIYALTACGGGGSSDGNNEETPPPAKSTGVLLDSPVANIGYQTETLSGVTDGEGKFEYVEGESVTFFIGDLTFPPVVATGIITPLTLANSNDVTSPTVMNILRLLQSLDEDGDTSDGIQISPVASSSATQVDFTQSVSDFENDAGVINLVANSGSSNTSLITEADALSHFVGTLSDTLVSSIAFDTSKIIGQTIYYVDVYDECNVNADEVSSQVCTTEYYKESIVFNSDGSFAAFEGSQENVSGSYSFSEDAKRLLIQGTDNEDNEAFDEYIIARSEQSDYYDICFIDKGLDEESDILSCNLNDSADRNFFFFDEDKADAFIASEMNSLDSSVAFDTAKIIGQTIYHIDVYTECNGSEPDSCITNHDKERVVISSDGSFEAFGGDELDQLNISGAFSFSEDAKRLYAQGIEVENNEPFDEYIIARSDRSDYYDVCFIQIEDEVNDIAQCNLNEIGEKNYFFFDETKADAFIASGLGLF